MPTDVRSLVIAGRTPVVVDFDAASGGYDENGAPKETVPSWKRCHKLDANCVSSFARLDENYHLPVFDVDVGKFSMHRMKFTPLPSWKTAEDLIQAHFPDQELRWVPSTTPGHHHVYVDYPYTWEDYSDKLKNLASVQVIEPGYVGGAMNRGTTICRLPHVKKEPRAQMATMRFAGRFVSSTVSAWWKDWAVQNDPIVSFKQFTVPEAHNAVTYFHENWHIQMPPKFTNLTEA